MNVKKWTVLVLIVPILVLFCPFASAMDEEMYEKSGATQLYQNLDRETKELLSQAGAAEGRLEEGWTGQGLLNALGEVARDKIYGPLQALAAFTAICLLCRLASCFEGGELVGAVPLAGTAASGVVMAGPVLGLMAVCQGLAESASAFIAAAVPVYAGLLAASGSTAAASGYSFAAMAAGGAIPLLTAGIVLPLLRIYLAISIASAVSGTGLAKLTGSLYSFGKWALVTAVTVFTGVLSIQTAMSAQVDAAAGKAAKLALSSGVPIVGGALGDAVAAIQNSVHIVKSGAGAFGILAALCIFGPAMVECGLWVGVCAAGQAMGELFEAPKLGAVLGAFSGTVRMILAAMASICAVCLASAAAVIFVHGG